MGVVYYGHYAQYFEVGRAEAIRQLGLTYRQLEDMGILMPVIELVVNYHLPARYDDLLLIRTTLKSPPGHKITFTSDILDEDGKHLTSGHVTLAFIRKQSGRPCPAPPQLLECIQPHFT